MRSATILALVASSAAMSPALAASHTITVNTVQIFGTIDPAKISDYTDYMASANLYDGLANVDPKGNLVPELASSWDGSPDASSVMTRNSRTDLPCRPRTSSIPSIGCLRSTKDPPISSPAF
jgi:ABC-type transport system substrate-binding protein